MIHLDSNAANATNHDERNPLNQRFCCFENASRYSLCCATSEVHVDFTSLWFKKSTRRLIPLIRLTLRHQVDDAKSLITDQTKLHRVDNTARN